MRTMFSGVTLNLPNHEILDCGAFYEVIFLHLAQESVWELFLQLQGKGSPGAGFIGDPVEPLVLFTHKCLYGVPL